MDATQNSLQGKRHELKGKTWQLSGILTDAVLTRLSGHDRQAKR